MKRPLLLLLLLLSFQSLASADLFDFFDFPDVSDSFYFSDAPETSDASSLSPRDGSSRMRIHSSCGDLKKSHEYNRGFMTDAYGGALDFSTKVTNRLEWFVKADKKAKADSMYRVMEKGLDAMFGLTRSTRLIGSTKSFKSRTEGILNTFKGFSDALRSDILVYCDASFANATRKGKTYEQDTGKKLTTEPAYKMMWIPDSHEWGWVPDPPCPSGERLGVCFFTWNPQIILLCKSEINKPYFQGLLEPIWLNGETDMNHLLMSWTGILSHETLHSRQAGELKDLKTEWRGKTVEAYEYLPTKALAARDINKASKNVNNHLFFGFGVYMAMHGWEVSWANGAMRLENC